MHIVTGMHRSGTSFVSQALHWLGADFGDPELLYPADHWNQNGYFENIEIIDINNKSILGHSAKIENWLNAPQNRLERLINSIQSMKWKYLFFPSIQSTCERALEWHPQMRALHNTYRGKYVKDPRFCLTINAWQECGTIESMVFIFRNPASVAGSVRRREGLPLSFGYKYWLYHIENFFAYAPKDVPLYIFDFDNFFNPETQQDEFNRLVNLCHLEQDQEWVQSLSSQLDISLRTQTDPGKEIPKVCRDYYEQLNILHQKCSREPILLGDFSHLFRD